MVTRKETAAESPPFTQKIIRYQCAAHNCPMVGSIFPGGGQSGVCGYHYDTQAHEWRRTTQILIDWACVTDEINAARRAQINPKTSLNAVAMQNEFTRAWRTLEPLANNWTEQLRPLPNMTYAQWGRHLEKFMNEILKVKRKAL